MKRLPYPEQQKLNPWRKPAWRWHRACDLIRTGQYLSRKRDDEPTGIAVQYIREVNRSLSELRLKRVRQRFVHVANALDIWQAGGAGQLEIESRILARQNDTEIGLSMNLPAPTIQAYADFFFCVREWIDANSYILFQVIKMHPSRPPTPMQLMQACAYHHGPALIEPWLEFLRDQSTSPNLTSAAGRMAASFDLLHTVHSLPDDAETTMRVCKHMPIFVKNEWRFATSAPATSAFCKSTDAIIGNMALPSAELEPFSYARSVKPKANRGRKHNIRKVA